MTKWETNDPANAHSLLADLQLGQQEDARKEVIDLTRDDSSDDDMNESLPPDDGVNKIPSENDVVDMLEQNVVVDDEVNNIPSENDVVDRQEQNVVVDDQVNNVPNEKNAVDMPEHNVVVDGRRYQGLNENMAEKHAREKAERPIRDRMRYYLINRWLSDYERYPQEQVIAGPDEALDC